MAKLRRRKAKREEAAAKKRAAQEQAKREQALAELEARWKNNPYRGRDDLEAKDARGHWVAKAYGLGASCARLARMFELTPSGARAILVKRGLIE